MKPKGEKVVDTQWHNLIAWGKTADLIESYVTKGKEIAIEGKLISRSYEAKEGGKRYITEINVREILLLGRNSERTNNDISNIEVVSHEAVSSSKEKVS